MRSLVRPLVVGALALPLVFAGAGLASAAEMQPRDGVCDVFSCSSLDQDTSIEDNDTDTSVINAGIMG
ncbi:hypothetical protein QFW96_26025 [Saccharopolyspora sp. TS4A08]|uniref:Secreted protein n=1 Tax=Saccharopolyspora ipomoeae TaxID=3042027 RepID=A0ABT6PVR6_9PSEU|nr:hypothetical protein [Saccharopolyspora sp. TS4A08]MDI2032104.1 hypothetical protein [Saccharopolyspora sp. TS4A08]